MKKQAPLLLSSFIILFVATTYYLYTAAIDISYDPGIPPLTGEDKKEKKTLYFGIISRYAPNLIYKGYQPIMDYLSDATPYHFELRLSSSYNETIQQLVENDVSAAFLGSYIYINAHEKYGITCIARPLNKEGLPYFHSVVVTRDDNRIHSIKDLKNKKLALPSAYSLSGNWLLKSELAKNFISISDLDSVFHFDHHHTVAYQILKGNFDVGVIKDRVAAEFLGRGLRVIKKSDPIPSSPIVVSKNAPREVILAIKEALLAIDIKNDKYTKIMQSWDNEFIYGFQETQNNDYDNLRLEVKNWNNK